jgi:hypothetical protein
MDRSQSVQSSTDYSTDPESPQPQNLVPTNEIPTNIVELDDLQTVNSRKPTIIRIKSVFMIFTEISNVGQPTDDSPIDSTPETSSGAVPIGITQSEIVIGETFQLGTTHVDQESTTSIDVLIRDDGVTTLSKDVKSKVVKRSKGKNLLNIIFRIEMLIIDVHLRLERMESMRYPIDFEIKPKVSNE